MNYEEGVFRVERNIEENSDQLGECSALSCCNCSSPNGFSQLLLDGTVSDQGVCKGIYRSHQTITLIM